MDIEALRSIGLPIAPGPPRLLRGEAALRRAERLLQRAAQSEALEPEMIAAWVSALRSHFPEHYQRGSWPHVAIGDHDRYVKLRRLCVQHLCEMF